MSEIREQARSQLRKAQAGAALASVEAEYVPVLVSAAPTSEAEARWRNAYWLATASRIQAGKGKPNLAYLLLTSGMNEYGRGSNALFGGSSDAATIQAITEGGADFLLQYQLTDVAEAMTRGASAAQVQAQQEAPGVSLTPLTTVAEAGARAAKKGTGAPYAALAVAFVLLFMVGIREADAEARREVS